MFFKYGSELHVFTIVMKFAEWFSKYKLFRIYNVLFVTIRGAAHCEHSTELPCSLSLHLCPPKQLLG